MLVHLVKNTLLRAIGVSKIVKNNQAAILGSSYYIEQNSFFEGILSNSHQFRSYPGRNRPIMKFVQFKNIGGHDLRLGLLCESDPTKLLDLSQLNCYPAEMSQFIKVGVSLDEIKVKAKNLTPISLDDVKILPPVTNPQKILCIGLNYKGHCAEQNKEVPKTPMFFSKYASTLVGPQDNIIAHKITDQIDWEVELAVIIGKEAKHVKKAHAMEYVFGYSVAQDISARDWQKQRNGGQFLIGKSMDTFCPLGPAIVHKSCINDPHHLQIQCSVNGVLKQDGNTNELVFRIEDIIEQVTQSITLVPGDVILTGTPAGVGMHRKPAEFLKVGDIVESEIQHVGKICNTVVADE